MRKKLVGIIIALIFVIGVVCWGLFYTPMSLSLKGESYVVLNYKDEYSDEGSIGKIFWFVDQSVNVKGSVDTSVLGTYVLEYQITFGDNTRTVTRTVEVKDLEEPSIIAYQDNLISIFQGGKFSYPSIVIEDNYDDVKDIVVKYEVIDLMHITTHFAKITATDTSGNVGVYIQPVAVYSDEEKINLKSLSTEMTPGIYQMNIIDEQLYLAGYGMPNEKVVALETDPNTTPIKSYEYNTNELSTVEYGFFDASIDLGEIDNGTYTLKLVASDLSEEYPLLDKYTLKPARLGRWHIKDKLVSFDYSNGIVITVEDFKYEYDIVIDVGHGDDDPGATGLGIFERELNLKVSLYEKQRYEAHGLKVWLTRDNAKYEKLLGDSSWGTLQKVSYTTGWYGAVSKYTYSNHHNSDEVGATRGSEIIVLPNLTKEELKVEYQLYETYKVLYPKSNTKWPIFTRSYNTGRRISRSNGEVVNERIFYANMRYPYECFGVVVTTYEAAYINNAGDYNWYVTNEGWKRVSEAKIKAYVEALGLQYIAP